MRQRKKKHGNMNIVGKSIERIRKEKMLKQRELLAKLQINGIDISASSLSKIEGQWRSVTDIELCVFAKTLDVSIEELLKPTKDS